MKEKGFTLIELLAIIVLLAIISLIIAPTAISIINNTKEKSYKRSAELYLDGVKTNILKENLKENINPDYCEIIESKLMCDGKEIEMEIKGAKPSEGQIYFEDGKIAKALNLKFKDKYITKKYNSNKMIVSSEKYYMCRAVTKETATYQTDGKTLVGKIPTGEFNIGDEYICDVNEKESYHFYVVSREGKKVNLILDRNILSNGTLANSKNGKKNRVQWISKEDYIIAGGTEAEYGENGNNNKGPITALNYLNEATKNWSYVNPINREYISKIDDFTEKYRINLTGKARLITYKEIIDNGCKVNGEKTCPLWLVNNLTLSDYYPTGNNIDFSYGYWSMEAYQYAETYPAWLISNKGSTTVDKTSVENFGVRPVIEVNKQDIEHGENIIVCTLIDNDGDKKASLSDMITCGSESFYVMSNENNKITMLAQYRIDLTSNIQNPNAEPIAFSKTEYWLDDSNNLKSEYGTSSPVYIYDENSHIYPYVKKYEEYLKNNGVRSASATLMSYEQAVSLGCNRSNNTCKSAPSWVYSTSYWLGSWDSYGGVWFVASYGSFQIATYYSRFEVRPVVTISTFEI